MRKSSSPDNVLEYKAVIYRTEHKHFLPEEVTDSNRLGKYEVLSELKVDFAPSWEALTHREGIQFRFEVQNVLEWFEEDISDEVMNVIQNPYFLDPISNGLQDYASVFFEKTVEGQHLLERIVSEYTSWDETRLNLPVLTRTNDEEVVFIEDLRLVRELERNEGSRWQQDKSELERFVEEQKPLSEPLEIRIADEQKYSYCIRLIDEDWNHWMYIGETQNLVNTLQNHVSQGGTFKKSKQRKMEVINIEEVTTERSKGELLKGYKAESDVPSKRICGSTRR
jgi:hypothetical protein